MARGFESSVAQTIEDGQVVPGSAVRAGGGASIDELLAKARADLGLLSGSGVRPSGFSADPATDLEEIWHRKK